MKSNGTQRRFTSLRLTSALCTGTLAFLQLSSAYAQQSDQPAATEEIVVTGSRIRQTQADLPTPMTSITTQQFEDNGYITAAQALNTDPSINPSFGVTANTGSGAGPGYQYPALFGLGAGRTLTLMNGQRMVNTANGGGDPSVDSNMFPLGLLDHVDIVQAGGAAVYGSDAIAGVVNYVMKDHFVGVQLDTQASVSTYGDNPEETVRFTAGTDFLGHKGNVAIDIDWSKTQPLYEEARPYYAIDQGYQQVAGSSPPIFNYYTDRRFDVFNTNGVIFSTPAPVSSFIKGQFDPTGTTILPYNYGTGLSVPFSAGGDGYAYRDLSVINAGMQRQVGNMIAHYDITDHLKVSAELMYGRTDSDDPLSNYFPSTVLNGTYSVLNNAGAIPFNKTNPYLSAADITALSAASSAFATGGNLYYSKLWIGLVPQDTITTDEMYRGRMAFDGDFDIGSHNYYWTVSFSHGLVHNFNNGQTVDDLRFSQALNAVTNSSGQIVCAVNNPTVTVAGCAPINPFGTGTVSKAAESFVDAPGGTFYRNTQEDLMGTLGGSIVTLPAGDAKFSVGYEHRAATTQTVPSLESQLGLNGTGVPSAATSGEYHTNEYSAELNVPVIGKNFTLPLVEALDLTGAARHVDNSLTASENVWSAGMRWQVIPDIALRGSLSRNFRAPDLNQVFAPVHTALGSSGVDPCDFRYISTGTVPATRLANCTALFTANPTWGLNSVASIPAGSSVAARLANFQDPAVNFTTALITSSGNPGLLNEVSHTKTFGVVLEPRFVPGLTFTADRVIDNLTNGLSAFTTANFLQACLDSSPLQTGGVCGVAVRDPVTGYVISGKTEYFNAGRIRFHGEIYQLDYHIAVSSILGNGKDYGKLSFHIDATHTSLQDQSVTGFDESISSGTTSQPSWVGRLNIGYSYEAFRFAYQASYRGPADSSYGATYLTTATPYVNANIVQNLSASYTFMEHYQVRLGINNFLNQYPSYPTTGYGDYIGRTFYAGLKISY